MTDADIAAWSSAEDTLYSQLWADPQAYERVVALVGVLVAHLREHVHDLDGLVAASRRGAGLVAEVAPDQALPWVPLEAALRAACAMRHREIRVTLEHEHRLTLLREAAASGAEWVRIVDPTSSALPHVAPALVVHVRSGMAIDCSTEMDVETGGPRFVARPVITDMGTGAILAPLPAAGVERSAPSPTERDAHVEQLQRLIEDLDRSRRVV